MKINSPVSVILIVLTLVSSSCKKNEADPPDINMPQLVQVDEGNAFHGSAVLLVTLSKKSDKQISLKWSTSDGTAIAGEDYVAVTDSILVFQPGETVKNIEVKIINDQALESDENFYVTASNAVNAGILKNKTLVNIVNDDAIVPVLNIATVTNVTEGNSTQVNARISVSLTAAYNKEVSLKWSTVDGTAKAGDDYTPATGTTLVFAPGETLKYIEVPIVNDLVFEFNDTLSVTVYDVTNASIGNTRSKIITNNDDVYIPEIAADGPITPESYPGMQLVWSDEFNGTSVNLNWWAFELGAGGWGNNELQSYTNSPNNAFVTDGKLNIVAIKNGSAYTSARMITKGKKEFTYGRIDIRAKMPFGKGIWPALWMLGGNINQVGWPKCGEIDIMEYLGQDVTKTYGTAHYDDGGHMYKGGSYTLPGGQGYNDQFHVFTILWQENSITWYVDYNRYFEVTPTNIKFSSFELPQFFIFNMAVGGNWPGYPDATTVFPQTMQVDYVRIFQP
jgi:beta-glucanase (GH16 family)